jgi:hypothetical protein
MTHTAGLYTEAGVAEEQAAHRERKALARRILLESLFLGGLADSLLRAGLGIGLFLWMVAAAAIAIHMARNRSGGLSREQSGWLVVAVFFAGCFAWRDSSGLLFYDFIALNLALLLLGATLSPASRMRSILGQRVRDITRSLGAIVGSACVGIVPTMRESALGNPRSWRGGRVGMALRAVLLALPVVLVFGALFESADPMFGSLLALPKIDIDVAFSHVLITGVLAWITAGWLRGAFAEGQLPAPPVRDRPLFALGSTDITAVLGSAVILFALFVGVQIGWLFGGERLVRSTTGLSYAEYARHGFFQLVFVALLVLLVLLASRAAIAENDDRAIRRHRLLATPLLLLVGGVMVSALGRMALYVHYYGLSADRLYASVFMGWLAIVLAWFGVTILRGKTRDFAAGMTITGFFTLAALNAVNPDALVARANIARATEALQVADSIQLSPNGNARVSSPIDYLYLAARLDGDAVEEVVRGLSQAPVAPVASPAHAVEVRSRCAAVRRLLTRWGPKALATDWRLWSVGEWRGRSAVRQHERQLRGVTCMSESGEQPFGTRETVPPAKSEQDETPQ